MPEVTVPTELVGKRYLCEEEVDGQPCGKSVSSAGEMRTTHTPTYAHLCPDGHVSWLDRTYPAYDVMIYPYDPEATQAAEEETP